MKPNQLFTSMLAVTALFVASCSAPKMAQNNTVQDDVYNTTAQAKEYKPAASVQTQVDNSDSNGDYYGKTDPNYDMDYSSRIDRFYYGNPNRGYYDPYYNYYGYNSFYDPFWGGGLSMYYGSYFNNPFNRWGWGGFYGGWGFDPYWGMYSNYNYFGTGYYGGWGGGWGGGFYAGRNVSNPNYGPRPDRGGENGYNRARGSYGSGSNGVPSRANSYGNPNSGAVTRSRAESYNPATNGGTTTRPNTSGNSSRPTRTSTESSRPTRSEAPSRPTYSPPPQQSSPPPSSSGGGSRGGGSSSGGSSSSGGGRPGRG